MSIRDLLPSAQLPCSETTKKKVAEEEEEEEESLVVKKKKKKKKKKGNREESDSAGSPHNIQSNGERRRSETGRVKVKRKREEETWN